MRTYDNSYYLFPFDLDLQSSVPLSDECVHGLRRFAERMAEREKELSDWLIEKSNLIMKTYMIGGTILSVLYLSSILFPSPLEWITQDLLVGAVNGAGWNLTDSVGGILATPKLFREAKKSALNPHVKMALAWTNAIYFSTVLPGLSLWGFATLVQSAKTAGLKAIIASGVALGASAALASSAFAFAGGMFVAAAISGFSWYRAAQKSEPVLLLRDRLKKHDVLQNKIAQCNDAQEKKTLEEKSARIMQQAEALAVYCNDSSTNKLTEADKKHSVFQTATTRVLTSDQQSKQTKLAEYLIQKQQNKIKEKRFDTIANVIGGVGALFGGLALLIPPVAIPLLIGSVVCFAISSVMKGYQLYEKYQLAKEKKKALKNNPGLDLVDEYFENTPVPSDGLSDNDKKKHIPTMQCQARLFNAKQQEKQKGQERRLTDEASSSSSLFALSTQFL